MSEFRLWLLQMWHAHKEELESYNQPVTYSSKEYFKKYKYWLKREYRYQKKLKLGDFYDRITR